MNDVFRILIVEDDLLIAEMLREMLLDLGYRVTGVAQNYAAALSLLGETKPQLCFVDIHLSDTLSGLDLVKKINEAHQVPVVFLTSYSDKKTIGEAAALKPEAYLVKPFSATDLYTTVEIIRNRRNSTGKESSPKTIVLRDAGLSVKMNTDEIRWLKSDNIYVEVKTIKKNYLVRNSLERFMEELNDESFVRTHRSFAVNIKHVNAVNGQYLLVDTEKIPLSRKFREEIHSRFNAV